MSEAYRRAGVDLEAAERAVTIIKGLAAGTARPEVVEDIGGFAGLFRIGEGRLLAAATDGVGTKSEVAREFGRLEPIGIDLVAMCANDVVCTGAEPLFFLDYIALGRLVPGEVAEVVTGIAEGCRIAGCALLGGETAEHPGVIEDGRLDLAGFCVGLVVQEDLLGPARVRAGDVLIGFRSSGPHANGFSLIRRIVEEVGTSYADTPSGLGAPLGDVLLEPTAIYVRPVLAAAKEGLVGSVAHVTGGGLIGNLPRALPAGLGAEVDTFSWTPPPIFEWIATTGGVEKEEMYQTFNMGIGMVLVAAEAAVERLTDVVGNLGVGSLVIGRVIEGGGVRLL
ncbi:MAG: phosphoribosylformylglycinamidine cyclo-ligase [Actinomycetota bacterium]